MNATALQCGHEFVWDKHRPNTGDLVFCRRCENYRRTVKGKKRTIESGPPKPERKWKRADIPQIKANALKMLNEGESLDAVAFQSGVAVSTLRNWKKNAVAG